MNALDLAVLAIVLVYAFLGYRRGFMAVASELVALAVGLGAALWGHRQWGGGSTGWGPAIVFITIWLAVTAVVEILFKRLLRLVPEEKRNARGNKMMGILPSALKGVVASALLVTLYVVASRGSADEALRRSLLAEPLSNGVMKVQGQAANAFGGAVEEFQQRMGRQTIVEQDSGVPLGFQTNGGVIDEKAEQRMLDLLNRERASRRLPPVQMDNKLRIVARSHALDMLQKGYFAHDAPDGATPFDRMRRAGITYQVAGENLAKAPTVEVAHDGLMKSLGHRRNILTKGYGRVGVGAVSAGVHGVVFVQEFTD